MLRYAMRLWDSPAQFAGDVAGAVALFGGGYGALFMAGVLP